jgi:hypothetical protein
MSIRMLWSIYFHIPNQWNYILGRDGETVRVFWIQKKVIRSIIRVHKHESCRHYVKKVGILALISSYILEVLFYKEIPGKFKTKLWNKQS